MSWVGPVVGGLATLGATFLQNRGQKKANEQSRDSAREQMAFQERMSSTAIQRQRADLAAAGINPVLAARLGGASSPSGAGYTAQNEFSHIGEHLSSAAQIQKNIAEVRNMRAQEGNIESQTLLNKATAKKVLSDMDLNKAEKAKAIAVQPIYDSVGGVVDAGVSTAKGIKKTLSNVYHGRSDPMLERLKSHFRFVGRMNDTKLRAFQQRMQEKYPAIDKTIMSLRNFVYGKDKRGNDVLRRN